MRHAITIASAIALSTLLGCAEATDASGAWSDLRCWSSTPGDDLVCSGTIEGSTVRVIPPSVFSSQVSEGRYVAVVSTCDVGPLWDSFLCFDVAAMPGARVCVAELDGVLVSSPDPCADYPDAGYIEIDGVLAWPTDPADFSGLDAIAWPG